MKRILALIPFAYCALQAYLIHQDAVSIMHQLYSGIWMIMAVLFLCTACIVDAIYQTNKESISDDQEEK